MGYNVPTGTDTNISFGPAIVYIGTSGATPSTDVGYIRAEDGVTWEVTREVSPIEQGNPLMAILHYDTRHAARVTFNSIEWNYNRMIEALGSGTTNLSGDLQTLTWGGDPTPTKYAMVIEHASAQSSHTHYLDLWQVRSAEGFSVTLSGEPHSHPRAFSCERVTSNWAGAALSRGNRLFRYRRQTA